MSVRICALAAALAAAIAAAAAGTASAQDAAKGANLVKQRCSVCHTVDRAKPSGGLAPNLIGLNGRKSAARTDFAYSKALKASDITWSAATLDRFLAGPNKVVPGTRMNMAVPGATDRADIVAYLVSLKGR